MNWLKIILTLFFVALLAIQFLRPRQNISENISRYDISKVFSIPDSVMTILTVACYDCHSNNTRYPWYSVIQPVAWFLTNHIVKAKEELNFSEFGDYSLRRQISKLNGIANSLHDNTMPLPSYRLMHRDARLNPDEKRVVIEWAEQQHDTLSLKK